MAKQAARSQGPGRRKVRIRPSRVRAPGHPGLGAAPRVARATPASTRTVKPAFVRQSPRQPAVSMSAGESAMTRAMPVGMNVAHMPSARRWWRAAAAAATSEGAATTTVTKPTLSISRARRRVAAPWAKLPVRLPRASAARPASRVRRRPHRSTTLPPAMPPAAAVALKSEATQPAATSPRPSSALSTGSAGGALPYCMPATMPAAMEATTTPHRVPASRVADAGPVFSARALMAESGCGPGRGGPYTTLPGFMMSWGSRARLSVRMSSISTGLL